MEKSQLENLKFPIGKTPVIDLIGEDDLKS